MTEKTTTSPTNQRKRSRPSSFDDSTTTNNKAPSSSSTTVGSLDAVWNAMQLLSFFSSSSDNDSIKSKQPEDEFNKDFFDTFDFLQAVYLPSRRRACPLTTNKAPRVDDHHHHHHKEVDTNETDAPLVNNHQTLTWQDVPLLFQRLHRQDQESWCVETAPSSSIVTKDVSLSPNVFWKEQRRAYCSFLVQHDRAAYQETLQRLPLKDLCTEAIPTNKSKCNSSNNNKKMVYEPCLWFFFGWNIPPPSNQSNQSSQRPNNNNNNNGDDNINHDLPGRPDHTDSILHDGTWHYQLSGIKRWYLRPTVKLLEQWKERQLQNKKVSSSSLLSLPKLVSLDDLEQWIQQPDAVPTLCIECQPGDVIVVNTRLWWHRTVLPPQSVPSVSYARDFRIQTSSVASSGEGIVEQQQQQQQQHGEASPSSSQGDAAEDVVVGMTNVDGLYAANDIDEGTILFTDQDMPDCELHRSATNWNCRVVELDNGTSAVVSVRPIAAGDFFSVPESDEDEEEEEEEEEVNEDECENVDN